MKNTGADGFTLIELMVVITIIIILSTIGVGSYRSVRARLTLDLEVDRTVTALNKFQADARAVSASQGPICIRVIFEKEKSPQKIVAPYKNALDGCDWSAAKNSVMQFSQDIVIQNNVTVSFAPPSGKLKIETIEREVVFYLKRNPSLTRKISFNAAAGTIEKIKP